MCIACTVHPTQRQQGSSNCGPFVLAFAASGQHPEEYSFDQGKLCQHLYLEEERMDMEAPGKEQTHQAAQHHHLLLWDSLHTSLVIMCR